MFANKTDTFQSQGKLKGVILRTMFSPYFCLRSLFQSISPTLFGQIGASQKSDLILRKRKSECLRKIQSTFLSWTLVHVIFIMSCSLLTVFGASTEPSGIQVDPDDGGYTGIVFEIKDEVPEESCAEILQNLQVGPLFPKLKFKTKNRCSK